MPYHRASVFVYCFADCGQTKYDEEISTRISSGKTAKPGEYPWHVLFRASEVNNKYTDNVNG